VFGRGGGERTAQAMEVPFLGRIPIYPPICRGGDAGEPLVIAEPESAAARAFFAAAEQVAAQVSIASYQAPVIPVTEVK
jgi:ATP-binding protein involved in chromosome partitioning